MEKQLLSPQEVEEVYGIKEATLAQWRHLSKGPDYFKLGASVKYKISEINKWLESNRVKTYPQEG